MVRLADFLGGLFAQVDQGRSQADFAGAALAQAYRDHPLLAEMPVPRVALQEVTLDLKVAVSTVASRTAVVTQAGRDRIIERATDSWRELPGAEPAIERIAQTGAWESAQARSGERVAQVLPIGVEIESDAATAAITAVFLGELGNALLELPRDRIDVVRDWSRSRIEDLFRRRLADILTEELRPQEDPGAVDVLVTASELASVAPDHLTSMRVVLRESDRSWTSFEDAGGEKRFKLVPE